jgi:hypothetical protein
MITKPTLFILGAGASIPYGFPSGWDLRQGICEASQAVDADIVTKLNTILGIPTDALMLFSMRFKLSRLNSIDSFLSKHPEFSDIGKAFIAALLIPKENDFHFDQVTNDDDWYYALWNALVSNVSTIEELANNNIQIITFNYDRSLERFLHIAIKHTFRVTDQAALDALNYLNIHHVYGSLGSYGLAEDRELGVRLYNGKLSESTLNIARSSLKVIPEARSDEEIFMKAKDAFMWANHVCFLGFGFDPLNVERLGFKELAMTNALEDLPSKIITSGFGKTYGEIELARQLVLGDSQIVDDYGKTVPEWDYVEKKNLNTLRDFAWLLQ